MQNAEANEKEANVLFCEFEKDTGECANGIHTDHNAQRAGQSLSLIHIYAGDFAAVLAAIGVRVRPIDGGVGGPFGMSGIGIRDAVRVISPVTFDGLEAEGLGVPGVSILGAGLEAEMGRRVIVPEAPRGFITDCLLYTSRCV